MMKHSLSRSLFLLVATTVPAFAQAPQCPEGCVNQMVPSTCPLSTDGPLISASKYRVAGCSASVTAAYGESKTTTCDANPPPGTVLVDYVVREGSATNGHYTVSRLQSGADIQIEKQISEDYDYQESLAVEKGDDKAAAAIRQMKKSHLELVSKYKTNKDLVHVEVSASGHGWALDRKRGWQNIAVALDVVCLAPANLNEQIADRIASNFTTAAIIRNHSTKDYWISTAIVEDPSQGCATATRVVRSLVTKNESRRFELKGGGKEAKLCLLLGNQKPKAKEAMKTACEYKAGDSLVIDDNVTYPCSY
ncbi:hypothetical protein [Sinorhizobium fredii]|uniref:hypothetical protein n=1 Tax=Rhizobium fredii TaxID=380 RepID=UPI0035111ABD